MQILKVRFRTNSEFSEAYQPGMAGVVASVVVVWWLGRRPATLHTVSLFLTLTGTLLVLHSAAGVALDLRREGIIGLISMAQIELRNDRKELRDDKATYTRESPGARKP